MVGSNAPWRAPTSASSARRWRPSRRARAAASAQAARRITARAASPASRTLSAFGTTSTTSVSARLTLRGTPAPSWSRWARRLEAAPEAPARPEEGEEPFSGLKAPEPASVESKAAAPATPTTLALGRRAPGSAKPGRADSAAVPARGRPSAPRGRCEPPDLRLPDATPPEGARLAEAAPSDAVRDRAEDRLPRSPPIPVGPPARAPPRAAAVAPPPRGAAAGRSAARCAAPPPRPPPPPGRRPPPLPPPWRRPPPPAWALPTPLGSAALLTCPGGAAGLPARAGGPAEAMQAPAVTAITAATVRHRAARRRRSSMGRGEGLGPKPCPIYIAGAIAAPKTWRILRRNVGRAGLEPGARGLLSHSAPTGGASSSPLRPLNRAEPSEPGHVRGSSA